MRDIDYEFFFIIVIRKLQSRSSYCIESYIVCNHLYVTQLQCTYTYVNGKRNYGCQYLENIFLHNYYSDLMRYIIWKTKNRDVLCQNKII